MNRAVPFLFPRPGQRFDFFRVFFQSLRSGAATILFSVGWLSTGTALADLPNPPAPAAPFPDAGLSLVRVIGALALVLGLFLGGVWVFKNWQRVGLQRGRQPKLNILENRSLGARQAVFVVGYERQRFLVATSPAGVNLLSHLPDAETAGTDAGESPSGPMSFGQALSQVLKRK
jgi:flagellar biogenesis protein FliO